MKKILKLTIPLLLISILLLTIYYIEKNKEKRIIIDYPIYEKENKDEEKIVDEYIDNNPIKIGFYNKLGKNKNRQIIHEYSDIWKYHTDIIVLDVFFSNEKEIDGRTFQYTFDDYYKEYENIENYKIGYKISFDTNDEKIEKYIFSPKDTQSFYNYLEIYLYDDYHKKVGVWYSHTTEDEMTDETLLTSIKLTAGKDIDKIISDISVTVFTYDNDDFDEKSEYRGTSYYSSIIKRS